MRLRYQLVTLLLLSLSLSTSFVSGENYSLPNGYETTEESITVQLKAYKEKILDCKLQIETSTPVFHSFLTKWVDLYDANRPVAPPTWLKYIGDTDNSCSFIVYPKLAQFKDNSQKKEVFEKRWIIFERYSCDPSLKDILIYDHVREKDNCYRGYYIYFKPETIIERMSMALTATEIIRKAPYDNETLTVFVQPEKQPISMCKLNIGLYQFKWFDFKINDTIIVNYGQFTSYSSFAQSGLEFIGLDDNSCSVRIHLDVLNTTNKENDILNQDWIITADGTDKKTEYSFYMNSKTWWNNNHYSKVYISKKFLFPGTDVQYF